MDHILKGHCVVFEEEIQTLLLNIYNKTNSFFHHWINELFLEENKVQELCVKLEKVAGSATYRHSQTI